MLIRVTVWNETGNKQPIRDEYAVYKAHYKSSSARNENMYIFFQMLNITNQAVDGSH